MRLWRISNYADLSGIGGKYAAGRWNHLGAPIVYCADHPALALLEALVHFDPDDMPDSYQMIEIDASAATGFEEPSLGKDWKTRKVECRDAFERFRAAGRRALLRVPSVIVGSCHNYLINPAHPDASRFRIVSATRHPLDPRFLR